MLTWAPRETEQTNVEEIHDALVSEGDVNVVDVREPDEWEAGHMHIPGAAMIPCGLLEYQAAEKLPDEESRIVVRCARGAVALWWRRPPRR